MDTVTLGLPSQISLRREVVEADRDRIGALVSATGKFTEEEVAIAVELVDERLRRGAASGYEFLMLESDQVLVGYSCYGLIPCTVQSFDLYWIVVDPVRQGKGLGKLLMRLSEEAAILAGGVSMYIDTSGQAAYSGTQLFYRQCGYELAAELPDFYAPGDSKQIYRRKLNGSRTKK